MAGVVRRDGLREAVTALRDEMLLRSDPYSRDYAARLSHALEAAPDADLLAQQAAAVEAAIERHHMEGIVHAHHITAALDDPQAALADERARVLESAADAIQVLHPGEVKASVLFLRDRAASERKGAS